MSSFIPCPGQQNSLPRTYLVKACQQSLDEEWDMKKTPGECPGAELPFKLLLGKELKTHVSITITLLMVKCNLNIYIYANI